VQKRLFYHVVDIAIFALGYFILPHPVDIGFTLAVLRVQSISHTLQKKKRQKRRKLLMIKN